MGLPRLGFTRRPLGLRRSSRGLHWLSAVSITRRPRVATGLQGVHLAWMDTTADGALWAGTTDGRLIAIEPDGRAAGLQRQ